MQTFLHRDIIGAHPEAYLGAENGGASSSIVVDKGAKERHSWVRFQRWCGGWVGFRYLLAPNALVAETSPGVGPSAPRLPDTSA